MVAINDCSIENEILERIDVVSERNVISYRQTKLIFDNLYDISNIGSSNVSSLSQILTTNTLVFLYNTLSPGLYTQYSSSWETRFACSIILSRRVAIFPFITVYVQKV